MPDARFWFAPGVEVFAGFVVPDPPPQSYRFTLWSPPDFSSEAADWSPASMPGSQDVTFRLAVWRASSEVAHYDLNSTPPDGWRWLAVEGKVHAERI